MIFTAYVCMFLGLVVGCGTPTTMPEGQTVERVIDGDTFVLGDGQRVRVLGIDSCERGTPGYDRARIDAEMALLGKRVRLTAPNGVNEDRYGRLLRYVETVDGDYGTMMVEKPHTTVYGGKNDAHPQYVRDLRRMDDGPMQCR